MAMSTSPRRNAGTLSSGSISCSRTGAVAFATTALSSETPDLRMRRPPPAPVPRSTFSGFHFPPDVIVIAVHWYLRFGRLKARLRPMRGLKQDHSARLVIAGHASVQNLRRGHYEPAVGRGVRRACCGDLFRARPALQPVAYWDDATAPDGASRNCSAPGSWRR